MDLSKYDTTKACQHTARLHLRAPDGEKLVDEETGEQLWIDLIGPDAPEYQSLQHKLSTTRLRRRFGKRGAVKLNTREMESDTIDLYAEATRAWGPKIVVDGEAVECTKANAVSLYHRFLWITRQVDEFMDDLENWLGESETGSSPSRAPTSNSSSQSKRRRRPPVEEATPQ